MWYKLNSETSPLAMGAWPQVKDFVGKAHDFLIDVKNLGLGQHLKKEYILDYVIIDKKSKFTDFISCLSCSSKGLIISERVFLILKEYNLFSSKFYVVNLTNTKEKRKYYFLKVAGDLTEHVDFNRTVFHVYKSGLLVKEFKCIDINDYLIKREEQIDIDPINPIKAVEIFFNESFYNLNYDLITLGMLNPLNILINDKLKERLELENLTGLRIEQVGKIKN